LMSMKLDQSAVLVLRHFHGFSYIDIGQILDIPERTVRSRLFAARNQLRELLHRRGIL
jgi:RNA polymerase sigma-70 factor (ECF subfamily)